MRLDGRKICDYICAAVRQRRARGCKNNGENTRYSVYDKELIAIAAKESGLSEHLFDGLDEKPTNSFLYSLVMGVQSGASTYCRYGDVTGSDNIFRIQAQVIRQIADKEPCVIVGRCADYILQEYENLVSVFVHANIEQRIERIMKRYDLKEKNAEDYINKTDKRRNSFYNFYTNRVWGSVDNYNLAIDTAQIGIKNAAEIIAEYVKKL